MKRLVVLVMVLLLCAVATVGLAERNFNIDVFKNGDWKVSIDDMEQRGFISSSKIWSSEMKSQPEYLYNDDLDSRHIKVTPDIYLAKYGTSKFVPYPRIWLDMHSKYKIYGWTFVQSVIIKVDDMTYTFEGNVFGNTRENQSWYYGSGWTEENLVCVCTDTDFMDAWIETKNSVKVRLKGSDGQVDFYLPNGSVQSIREMFVAFRDAGGYSYFK